VQLVERLIRSADHPRESSLANKKGMVMAKNNKKPPTGSPPKKSIHRFEFQHNEARGVWIAGSFNDWRPDATPMVALGDGRWVKELTLPPGRYEYRVLVDGNWVDDPNAKETVANPHGGMNAVITVG
jgi:1,4-alpha-glucan branching enzyme